jgi:hypothetical protein
MILKFIYTFFIGVLISLFVGLGIAAFYEQPKPPNFSTFPLQAKYPPPDQTQYSSYSAEMDKQQRESQVRSDQFQKQMQIYNRNVSIIAIVSAIIILVLSLTWFNKLLLIADGVLLGGLFTLMYSVIRGMETNDNKFRFFLVAVGLVIALILGYIKFIKTAPKK